MEKRWRDRLFRFFVDHWWVLPVVNAAMGTLFALWWVLGGGAALLFFSGVLWGYAVYDFIRGDRFKRTMREIDDIKRSFADLPPVTPEQERQMRAIIDRIFDEALADARADNADVEIVVHYGTPPRDRLN